MSREYDYPDDTPTREEMEQADADRHDDGMCSVGGLVTDLEELNAKYAVMGPGMSGRTNDISEARTWLANNPAARLYVLAASEPTPQVEVIEACLETLEYAQHHGIGLAATRLRIELTNALKNQPSAPPTAQARLRMTRQQVYELTKIMQNHGIGYSDTLRNELRIIGIDVEGK